jgi:A/G-specific adenine glycosylase
MINAFASTLLKWYDIHKRELPWRNETDPYKIWISEIILQQTRVVQGWDYYLRFIERFPNLQAIYDAGEQEVLRYWQGLGYYTRARNIYAGAVYLIETCRGIFPNSYDEILKIKGVGSYTAAAIASFAFHLPYPVIDGNVLRVLSRLHGIYDPIDTDLGKKKITDLANPSIFNQAMMDFGAIECTPQQPQCEHCYFSNSCFANLHCEQNILPVKRHKTKTRNRFFYYLHIEKGNHVYLQKRIGKDIWKGLYEFPLWETEEPIVEKNLYNHPYLQSCFVDTNWKIKHISPIYRHILTHQIISAVFIHIIITKPIQFPQAILIDKTDIDNYPVSRLMEKYLTEYFNKIIFKH